MRRVIPLQETKDKDAIGVKAYNLSLLFRSRFPVPGGFVIAAEAFDLDTHGKQDPDSWEFPASLRQEIEEAYRTYVHPPVAVRSSCSAEDLRSASFAGQYDSILNVTSANLLESIKRCRLSVYKDHAQSYLGERLTASVRTPAMSIIVQELVEADVSGVVFSQNPVTGNEDEMIVNASFGMGEAVVSGCVTPDFFVISKQEPSSVMKELGDKTCKTVLESFGTRLIETTADEKSSFCLRDEQLYELKNMVLAVQDLLGHPVDVEFAYRQGKLYLLQARPITI